VIPPDESTDFVYHMENVLSLYQEPYDPDRPVVCFDEHPTQLVKHVREPQSAEPGRVEREDYHYKPQGTKNLFLASEPLAGWRAVTVTDRRTTEDWVEFMQQLVEDHYSDVDCLRVVLDNLNTHNPAAFYDYLPPEEARRLLDTLEFHFTPVHGSWLNMAEIEINRLKGQCLDRRIAEEETLRQEVHAWIDDRNADESDINWRFTSSDARHKLQQLYPTL
jgi:hypothetical protein